MITASALATCIFLAAQTYQVPPAVLIGIMKVEGGKVGQEVSNTNGSHDLGPMQINTIWLPELADHWGVSKDKARQMVRDDACTNIGVSAWILRQHINDTGDLQQAVAWYHSRTHRIGRKYKNRVFSSLLGRGVLRTSSN